MAHSSAKKARIHVLTVSDTRTEADDEGGNICKEIAELNGHTVVGRAILPDEPDEVASYCRTVAPDIDVILISGGTGISPRDRTYEAVSQLLDKRLDGFGEIFRMLSFQEIGSKAMASRAVAGVFGGTLLFAMPGSPRAVRLAMEKLIGPELGHLVGELRK